MFGDFFRIDCYIILSIVLIELLPHYDKSLVKIGIAGVLVLCLHTLDAFERLMVHGLISG